MAKNGAKLPVPCFICPVCKDIASLRNDGKLRKHNNEKGVSCSGGGQEPLSVQEVTKIGHRPKQEFDLKEVEKLAVMQCTDEEIAAFLDTSVDTIRRRKNEGGAFAGSYEKGKANGKISLRRTQWNAAQGVKYYAWFCDRKQAYSLEYICDNKKAELGKNPHCMGCPGARESMLTEYKGGATGMQIWLGKNLLGQKDKQIHEHSGLDLEFKKKVEESFLVISQMFNELIPEDKKQAAMQKLLGVTEDLDKSLEDVEKKK